MPRLSAAIRNSAFFLHELLEGGEVSEPQGTGAFVGTSLNVGAVFHLYAVTAAHVVCDGASIIRINTKDGNSRYLEFDPSEWTVARDKAGNYWEDLAVIDVTELVKDGDEISFIPFSMFATQNFIDYVELDIGEDGFMLGLFGHHPGKKRNRIAARFGNISILASRDDPIEHDVANVELQTPCHVFDIHSRPGFSGSPVFVYRTMDGDLRDLETKQPHTWQMRLPSTGRPQGRFGGVQHVEIFDEKNNRFLKLLGVHVGQFHDEITLTKLEKISIETKGSDDIVKSGDEIRFPGSMTVVAPAWQIEKLLEEDSLVAKRETRARRALGMEGSPQPEIKDGTGGHSET